MKFTKIKNFTESNEVRIKASTSKGVIINKLVIYIGKEIVDKHFSESNYVNVKIIKDKLGRNDIYLSKAASGSDLRKYKFAITGNGTCQTRKLLVSMPKDTDMNKYINNKAVAYESIDNNLILHIDSKTKSKKSKKINKNKLIVNGIDQATLDNQFQNKFNELYNEEYNKYETLEQPITRAVRKARMKTENNIDPITLDKQFREKFNLDKQERNKLIDLYKIRTDLDSNNQYRYEELKKLIYGMKEYFDVNNKIQEDILNNLKNIHNNTLARLDFLDKKVDFLSPICKAMDRLEDKIDNITSKITPNENNSKELNNLGYDKLIINLIEHKHKTEERLRELENKVKNIKDDKRSLFDRIFGE